MSLEVVLAGAGSGKTTDLCRVAAAAVTDGVDPSRILATTFTRAAAAELKSRVQEALLKGHEGDSAAARRDADRLELAAIGTVHSVAHHLVQRYALQMGLSPRLEVLQETATARALTRLLGVVDSEKWDCVLEKAAPLSIEDLGELALSLLGAKRGNRISDAQFRSQMEDGATRLVELLLAGAGVGEPSDASALYEAASELLPKLEALNDTTGVTKKAITALRQLCSERSGAWKDYLICARLGAGTKSGANGMLEPLRALGATVRRNPRLHEDIREFNSRIAELVIWLEGQYASFKKERGLVDFTDLEVHFLELLENEACRESLEGEFQLVLVDEFQDTNPLQLAIFQRLRQLADRSRWVGDAKQAIYSFRGTDPELVGRIWNSDAQAIKVRLASNYRSQRGLVQLTGKLFEPLLGESAVQEPMKPSVPRGVERWLLETTNQEGEATSLACGIAALRGEGVRLGDIVVLGRRQRDLANLAGELESLGIPYQLESPGLLGTREGALVMAGLRLVADRHDSLAAAEIRHLLTSSGQETPDWIVERLTAVREERRKAEAAEAAGEATERWAAPWAGDEDLAPLEAIVRDAASPSIIMQQVIEALRVPSRLAEWGDPSQRSCHLDSMLRHAKEYEETALEVGNAATLSGLVLYLEGLAEDVRDLRHATRGHDAVSLITYHSAKGLEWPVVILGNLGFDRDPGMWDPYVTGGGGTPGEDASTGDPLKGRTIHYWPWPFGWTKSSFPTRMSGAGLDEDALESDEGKARVQQSEQEAIRLLYVGVTRAKTKLVFAHRPEKYPWLQQLTEVDRLLDVDQGDGEHEIEGVETTFVMRTLDPSMANASRRARSDRATWLESREAGAGEGVPDRYHRPSGATVDGEVGDMRVEHLPGSPCFPSGAKEQHYSAIGQAVHDYLAAIPSLGALTDQQKKQVASRCIAARAVEGFLVADDLVLAGERLVAWVRERFPGAVWYTETPVTAPRMAGGQWTGTVDLLLKLPTGEVVVVDHKSAPIRREKCAAKAAEFAGQLAAYQEVLQQQGVTVQSLWIHFPLAAAMAECPNVAM